MKKYKDRWSNEILTDVRNTVVGGKGDQFKRKAFPESPYGLTEEKLQDFRGSSFQNLFNVDCQDSDFSFSWGAISLSGCDYENCNFSSSKYFDKINGRFKSCKFTEIKVDGAAGLGALFENCDFTNADLKKSIMCGNFVNCIFKETDFLRVSWGGCFENCIFEGCKINASDFDEDFFDFNNEDTQSMIVSITQMGRVKKNQYIKFYSFP